MDKLLNMMEDYAIGCSIPVICRDSASLLAETVTAAKPGAILEIGTAIGYSTLIMAKAMPQYAHITTIEIDDARAAVACDYFRRSGHAGRIHQLIGDAMAILPEIEEYFDMVFIDAAKGQYLKYLKAILDKLLPGAVIFADNVLFRGWVRAAQTPPRRIKTIVERLRQYLAFVSSDARFRTDIYQIGDGVAISRYREGNLT